MYNAMSRKRRSNTHITEEDSYRILRQKLPPAWVIHEYGPDYGIDCVVELFDYVDPKKTIAETLGEVFYVQLKGTKNPEYATHRVFARGNVEKGKLSEDKDDHIDINVVKFQLETPELATVQAMGMAIPVLLILVDIATERAFFVCLNDYIDKILLPDDPNFESKGTKTIHIPLLNELGQGEDNLMGPRAYGKRAKMCGAFTKFSYQKKEIERAFEKARLDVKLNHEQILDMLETFTHTSLRQDIWEGHEFWEPIKWSHADLIDVRDSMKSGITPSDMVSFAKYCDEQVWFKLANLSNMYEELVREWFLPSYLAQLTSYPSLPKPSNLNLNA